MKDGRIGRDASFEEIEAATDALLGHTFGDIARTDLTGVDPTKVKGQFGELLEAYYGIQNNSDPGPDFRKAGVELKCKPLNIAYGDFFYPAEPLSVGHIDYGEVAEANHWTDVKKLIEKLQNLLIVWRVDEGENRNEYPIIWWQQWTSSEELDERIQQDYLEIRRQVRDGEHLSESRADNDFLSICPKHNSDFDEEDPETGSYKVNNTHPHLEKPQYMSWRLKAKSLNEMITTDTGLDTFKKGKHKRVKKEDLWELSQTQSTGAASFEDFLPNHTQSRLSDY